MLVEKYNTKWNYEKPYRRMLKREGKRLFVVQTKRTNAVIVFFCLFFVWMRKDERENEYRTQITRRGERSLRTSQIHWIFLRNFHLFLNIRLFSTNSSLYFFLFLFRLVLSYPGANPFSMGYVYFPKLSKFGNIRAPCAFFLGKSHFCFQFQLILTDILNLINKCWLTDWLSVNRAGMEINKHILSTFLCISRLLSCFCIKFTCTCYSQHINWHW